MGAVERTFSEDDAQAELGWKNAGHAAAIYTGDQARLRHRAIAEHAALGVHGEDDHGDTADATGGRQDPAR
ncbi:hypothetical protein BST45_12745 [Mycobacterium shinjukuense]|uniref:Uncharacterized protein n=1 Tax=Mycobacterium shinjukuense TaxID=398694 RepID=A0A7I7MUC8_9MYCO|nr:hypothetical protein BST45_12745 [Mycobacterium shinjukuense]BBX75550.1 hypothetical protein MSHI_34560 [Mycobacterium shinjukuense]